MVILLLLLFISRAVTCSSLSGLCVLLFFHFTWPQYKYILNKINYMLLFTNVLDIYFHFRIWQFKVFQMRYKKVQMSNCCVNFIRYLYMRMNDLKSQVISTSLLFADSVNKLSHHLSGHVVKGWNILYPHLNVNFFLSYHIMQTLMHMLFVVYEK